MTTREPKPTSFASMGRQKPPLACSNRAPDLPRRQDGRSFRCCSSARWASLVSPFEVSRLSASRPAFAAWLQREKTALLRSSAVPVGSPASRHRVPRQARANQPDFLWRSISRSPHESSRTAEMPSPQRRLARLLDVRRVEGDAAGEQRPNDSIATSTPSAPTDTLTPLEFQHRLLGRTSWSFGASTKTFPVRPFLSSANS